MGGVDVGMGKPVRARRHLTVLPTPSSSAQRNMAAASGRSSSCQPRDPPSDATSNGKDHDEAALEEADAAATISRLTIQPR